jgi:hypothetical protein
MTKLIYTVIAVLTLTGCATNVQTKFVSSVADYSYYDTVDWEDLGDKFYRPNTADWPPELDSLINCKATLEITREFWHLMQNARADFHRKSLPLRAVASKSVIEALDNTEALFDTMFVRCCTQEYYMRLLPDVYNEVMRPVIDELVKKINEDYQYSQRTKTP